MGQETKLPPATVLTRKHYRARSETDEHEHCAFCWAKFMDPDGSEAHRRFVAGHPDVLTEGYTTTRTHRDGDESHWVCPTCFDDFAEEFDWRLQEP
jgi:hypothetical protein